MSLHVTREENVECSLPALGFLLKTIVFFPIGKKSRGRHRGGEAGRKCRRKERRQEMKEDGKETR